MFFFWQLLQSYCFFVKTGKWIIPVQVLYIYAVCACFDVQKPRDALPEQEIVGMDWHKA